jgi:TIR domain
MADIFLSYAHEDVVRAARLVKRFEAEKWSVFSDRKIPPGKEWHQVLQAELTPARCVVVLWSPSSIKSGWVREEADDGRRRDVLVPVRLDPVEPPLGFRNVQACDLMNWDGAAESAALDDLIAAIWAILRKGVSIQPARLFVVVGRPKTHPDLGAAINLTCRFVNELEKPAELRGLTALARGPAVSYDFDWYLVYDESPGGASHYWTKMSENALRIPVSPPEKPFVKGVQFRTPKLTTKVNWPSGNYTFKLRGWVNRDRDDSLANLKCDFEANLDSSSADQISRHLKFEDKDWIRAAYHDDARGLWFTLGAGAPSLPAA